MHERALYKYNCDHDVGHAEWKVTRNKQRGEIRKWLHPQTDDEETLTNRNGNGNDISSASSRL